MTIIAPDAPKQSFIKRELRLMRLTRLMRLLAPDAP